MLGRLKAGEGDDRGWDGWMASPTQWTWVWVNSGSWWWTGRPGVLQAMGSQSRTRLSDGTELKWTDRVRELSSCGSWALEQRSTAVVQGLNCGVGDPPRSGIEPVSLALADGFFSSGLPGKPVYRHLKHRCKGTRGEDSLCLSTDPRSGINYAGVHGRFHHLTLAGKTSIWFHWSFTFTDFFPPGHTRLVYSVQLFRDTEHSCYMLMHKGRLKEKQFCDWAAGTFLPGKAISGERTADRWWWDFLRKWTQRACCFKNWQWFCFFFFFFFCQR